MALSPKPLGPDWCCYTCKNTKKCENFMHLDFKVGAYAYGYGFGGSHSHGSYGGIDPFFVNICLAYPKLYNLKVLTNMHSRRLGVKSGFIKIEKKCGSNNKDTHGLEAYGNYGKDSYGHKDSYGDYGKDSYGDYGKDLYGHKDY